MIQYSFLNSSEEDFMFLVVMEDSQGSFALFDASCEKMWTPYGPTIECPEQYGRTRFLLATGCFDDRRTPLGVSCKVENGLLLAHDIPSRWTVLSDDDAFWRLKMTRGFLDEMDHSVKQAFGFYPCGDSRGMPDCVAHKSSLDAQQFPKCFPVFTIMSRPSLVAIVPLIQRHYLQFVSSDTHYMHDTGLGRAAPDCL